MGRCRKTGYQNRAGVHSHKQPKECASSRLPHKHHIPGDDIWAGSTPINSQHRVLYPVSLIHTTCVRGQQARKQRATDTVQGTTSSWQRPSEVAVGRPKSLAEIQSEEMQNTNAKTAPIPQPTWGSLGTILQPAHKPSLSELEAAAHRC